MPLLRPKSGKGERSHIMPLLPHRLPNPSTVILSLATRMWISQFSNLSMWVIALMRLLIICRARSWSWLVGFARHSYFTPCAPCVPCGAPGFVVLAWCRLLPWGRRLACRAVVPKQGLVARSWLCPWPSVAQGLHSHNQYSAQVGSGLSGKVRKENTIEVFEGYAAHPPP